MTKKKIFKSHTFNEEKLTPEWWGINLVHFLGFSFNEQTLSLRDATEAKEALSEPDVAAVFSVMVLSDVFFFQGQPRSISEVTMYILHSEHNSVNLSKEKGNKSNTEHPTTPTPPNRKREKEKKKTGFKGQNILYLIMTSKNKSQVAKIPWQPSLDKCLSKLLYTL